MLTAVLCHVGLVLCLHVIQQCPIVIDNVLLTQGAGVVDHLNYLPLGVTVELLVLHDGEVLVLVVDVLPQTREVDGLVALAAEGLDTAGEGVAVQSAGGFLDSRRGGQLGLLEDGGVGGLARLPLPADGDVMGELLGQQVGGHLACVEDGMGLVEDTGKASVIYSHRAGVNRSQSWQ